jgi:hypothetical protein
MKINQDVFIHEGILDCQIDQLIEYSQSDSDIQKFTSDKTRFANKISFHQWQQQGRIIYTLSDSQKNLFGIIWFGQKYPSVKNVKANFTFAIRIYGPARGQGLAHEFMKITFNDFQKNQKKTKITGFWLETHQDNLSAINIYQKFGFKTVAENNGSLIMVL